MLGEVGSTVGKICFVFEFILHIALSHRRMSTYQHIVITLLNRYYVLFTVGKSDAGVGLGRRRRFLDFHGLRFSTTFERCW
jgi:hypothetical protein